MYRNEFNENISRLAFYGLGTADIDLSSASPELVMDGSFPKCVKKGLFLTLTLSFRQLFEFRVRYCMSDDILVGTRALTVDFSCGMTFLRALDNVDITIQRGEFVSLVGVSGSGKTTLLNAIGGLIVPTSGSIIFNSICFDSMNEEERTIFRRNHIGFIFQNYNLIPSLNIFQNICFSAQLSQKSITAQQVEKIAQQLGIEDKLTQMPAELSGGQQQRAAIARAMLARPSLLLADEPTGSLDSVNGRSIMQLLRTAVSENNMSVLMATHNEEFALQTDRIIHIEDGKIIAEESKK